MLGFSCTTLKQNDVSHSTGDALLFLGILDETGEINRKVLGPIVFSDKVGQAYVLYITCYLGSTLERYLYLFYIMSYPK